VTSLEDERWKREQPAFCRKMCIRQATLKSPAGGVNTPRQVSTFLAPLAP